MIKTVIHISGPSGSGKTTLLEKYKNNKNICCINTDEMIDNIAISIVDRNDFNKKYSLKIKIDSFFEEVYKHANKELLQIIKKCDKELFLIVGVLLVLPQLENVVRYNFFIKIDDDEIYKNRNIKSFNHIMESYNEMIKLYENKNLTPRAKDLYIMFKYKVQNNFLSYYSNISENNKNITKIAKDNGYKCDSYDKINKQVDKIINKK